MARSNKYDAPPRSRRPEPSSHLLRREIKTLLDPRDWEDVDLDEDEQDVIPHFDKIRKSEDYAKTIR